MNINHILYLVSPFGLGMICYKFLNIPDGSFWFCVWLGCIASIFFFTKVIPPAQESKFEAIKDIGIKSAYEDKLKEQRPYSYIVGFHVLVFSV